MSTWESLSWWNSCWITKNESLIKIPHESSFKSPNYLENYFFRFFLANQKIPNENAFECWENVINKLLHPYNIYYTRKTNDGIYGKKSKFFQLKVTFLSMNLNALFAWRNLIKRKQHCDIFQAKECDLHIWQTEIKKYISMKKGDETKQIDGFCSE